MKNSLLLVCLFATGLTYAQNATVRKRSYFTYAGSDVPAIQTNKESTKSNEAPSETGDEEDSSVDPPINKGFGFGVSLGYNRIFDNLYDVHLSPTDHTLQISSVSKTSFLLSTTVSAPIIRLGKNRFVSIKATKSSAKKKSATGSTSKIDYSRKIFQTMVDEKPAGPAYSIPYGLYLVATVNLLNFSEASSGSVFNKKIDGGLGLGYRLNDDVLIALTYEMISVRQPRDFLINDFADQQILVDNEAITDLNQSDDAYFIDKYLPSLSLKLVYQIRGAKVKEN